MFLNLLRRVFWAVWDAFFGADSHSRNRYDQD
jgi:hypothetical protein